MKKTIFLSLLLSVFTLQLVTSCSKDDKKEPEKKPSEYQMSVTPETLAMKVGEYKKLNVSFDPTPEVEPQITLISANQKIVKIEEENVVSAMNPGSTSIEVKAVIEGKEYKKTIPVTVKDDKKYEVISFGTDLPVGSDISISVGSMSAEALVDFGDGEFVRHTVSANTVGKAAQGTIIKGKVGPSKTVTIKSVRFFLLYAQNVQMNKIDLSQVGTLLYLRINNNNLTTVDFSKLKFLKEITLEFNKLSTLKISKENADLAFVNADDNLITSVDVAPNMESLRELTLSRNKLHDLHLPNGLNSLETLKCSQNHIETMDISNLPRIDVFYATKNGLTSVRIGNNHYLTNVRLNGNKLTDLEIPKAATKYLYRLKLYDNLLTAEVMAKIAKALPMLEEDLKSDSYIMLFNNPESPTEETVKVIESKNWRLLTEDK